MARRRRDIQAFSLSFLDCICCGFGAIILLLVISKIYEPVVVEEAEQNLKQLIALLQEELFQIRGTTTILDRTLKEVKVEARATKLHLGELEGDLTKIQGQYKASKENEDETIDIGELSAARQRLSEEQKRLRPYYRRPDEDAVAGIPVDSEYIIFVIDTSGSMLDSSWTLAQKMLRQTLEAYPTVKGIQVMNDDGVYMFRDYQARWMPDSPGRRQAIISRMRSWNATSDSNPVNGIEAAIRDFRSDDKKISIYVFGDDYQGVRSIDKAMAAIDRLNRPGPDGKRLIRIHGVGFPGRFGSASVPRTAASFATFMRAVCAAHGGTFVALSGG
ncbi:MAG: VWA domain-containing protein [Proteobacteria bacterium]|nr:VWA domain-containing protein [Pseudomonadota bacterium]